MALNITEHGKYRLKINQKIDMKEKIVGHVDFVAHAVCGLKRKE
jgi:hypothetical protein